jgi:hypothetical protein
MNTLRKLMLKMFQSPDIFKNGMLSNRRLYKMKTKCMTMSIYFNIFLITRIWTI